ncbi:unnamed protein product [Phytomonas sp. EM1]|nr:unnamed protein product [Phytomonas sp. EM1]|eukprot:CCW61224.1 unnamed protein product [Phytomonas sp. isolate EM1]
MESSQQDETYYVSVLILHQEILKLLMCLVVVAVYDFRKAFFPKLSHSLQKADDHSDIHQIHIFHKDKKVDTTCFQMHGNSSYSLNMLSAPADNIEIHGGDFMKPSSEVKSSVIIVDRADHNIKGNKPDDTEQKFNVDSINYVHQPRKHHKHLKCVARVTRFISVYYQCLYSIVITRDTLKLLVPAILFTGQNLLIFVGLRHLDPVSFQIWSQVKLLSAALFSVWMLDRHLSWMQWGSLALLTAGILLTQVRGTGSPSTSVGVSKVDYAPRAWEDTLSDKSIMYGTLLGIGSCLISGISSSYAGVYFEKVVKTTKATLAVRNLQLSIFAIPLAILSILVLEVLPNWSRQQTCGQTVQWNIFVRCRDPPPLLFWNTCRVNGTPCPTKPFYV